jgi:hypothetical protein
VKREEGGGRREEGGGRREESPAPSTCEHIYADIASMRREIGTA